jgi:signal transduction histidine kinase
LKAINDTDCSPGTGLGLAIAERVAHLHGGALTLANLLRGGFEARLRVKG